MTRTGDDRGARPLAAAVADKMEAIVTPVEALAEAWASIDGKLDTFRAEVGKPDMETSGTHAGYICEAEEMIKRLRARGYDVAEQPK